MSKYSFNDNLNHEAQISLGLKRDDAVKIKKIEQISSDITKNLWEKTPIDFNLSVYHSRPPKRNSKEAMRPWLYDKYSKSDDSIYSFKDSESNLINRLSKVVLYREANYYNNYEQKNAINSENFETSFRILSPNEDRFQTAKINGFRELQGEYRNKMPHDFRGVI